MIFVLKKNSENDFEKLVGVRKMYNYRPISPNLLIIQTKNLTRAKNLLKTSSKHKPTNDKSLNDRTTSFKS